jgi:hypothetical protein
MTPVFLDTVGILAVLDEDDFSTSAGPNLARIGPSPQPSPRSTEERE